MKNLSNTEAGLEKKALLIKKHVFVFLKSNGPRRMTWFLQYKNISIKQIKDLKR